MKWTLLICCFLGSFTFGFSQEGRPLTAAEISDRVIKAYADCETYRDTCRAQKIDINGVESKGIAKTVYQKGTVFRFEYKDTLVRGNSPTERKWTPLILWSDFKETKTKPDLTEELKGFFPDPNNKDFRLFFQLHCETTLDSSILVPLLIYPKGASKVSSLFLGPRCSIDGSETVENRQCYKMTFKTYAISGENPKNTELFYRYWIDKESFLILRYQQEDDYGAEKKRIRTLDYQTEINVKLTKEELAFLPSGK